MALLEHSVQEDCGRPAEHSEGLVVLKPTNVLHDGDRVYAHCEGEGGPEATLLLLGEIMQRLENFVEPSHPAALANIRGVVVVIAVAP